MANSIRVCDCFLDTAIYCLSEELPYANFFYYCLQARDDKRNMFFIMKGKKKIVLSHAVLT